SNAPSCPRSCPRAPPHAIDHALGRPFMPSTVALSGFSELRTPITHRSTRRRGSGGAQGRARRGPPPSGRGTRRAPRGGGDAEPGVAVSPPAPADLRSILALPPVATGAIADPQRGGA